MNFKTCDDVYSLNKISESCNLLIQKFGQNKCYDQNKLSKFAENYESFCIVVSNWDELIYIYDLNLKNAQKLEDFFKRIYNDFHQNKYEIFTEQPQPKEIFGILIKNRFYRAIQKKNLFGEKKSANGIEITLIDFGTHEKITTECNLYKLPKEIQNTPGTAIPCKLNNISNTTKESLLCLNFYKYYSFVVNKIQEDFLEISLNLVLTNPFSTGIIDSVVKWFQIDTIIQDNQNENENRDENYLLTSQNHKLFENEEEFLENNSSSSLLSSTISEVSINSDSKYSLLQELQCPIGSEDEIKIKDITNLIQLSDVDSDNLQCNQQTTMDSIKTEYHCPIVSEDKIEIQDNVNLLQLSDFDSDNSECNQQKKFSETYSFTTMMCTSTENNLNCFDICPEIKEVETIKSSNCRTNTHSIGGDNPIESQWSITDEQKFLHKSLYIKQNTIANTDFLEPYLENKHKFEIEKLKIKIPAIGSKIFIKPSALTSVSSFYGHLILESTSRYPTTITQLICSMNDPLRVNDFKKFSLRNLPKKSDLIIAKYTDGFFYRGRLEFDVTEIYDQNDCFMVFYLDYGNTSLTKFSDMRKWDKRFENLPFQAVQFYLNGVNTKIHLVKNELNSLKAELFLENNFLNKRCVAEIIKNNDKLVVNVTVKINNIETDLSTFLIEQGWANSLSEVDKQASDTTRFKTKKNS